MLTHENLKRFLEYHGIDAKLVEFQSSVVKSEEASRQVKDGIVVKSVVLVADGEFVIAVLKGKDRIDLEKAARAINANEVRLAKAKEVKATLGYDVGGVPPFGHLKRFLTLVDERVAKLKEAILYAGGGSHRHLLRLKGQTLFDALEKTGTPYKVVDLAE